jgi:GDP-L-fucose synthase
VELKARIFVAGHKGLVGSAILRQLEADGYANLLLRTRDELDLKDQSAVARFFAEERPEYVFLAAAKVGGIHANNTYPAEFIYENLAIQTNVIHTAWKASVKRLLFLGSSCIYPKLAPQPMQEDHLLTGRLEPTNEPYAIAKIAGIKMCEASSRQYGARFYSVMPTNLYGPNDNFDLHGSHVLPALLRKVHEAKQSGAKEVCVWGTGAPRREFLYVDDMASACVFLMNLAEADLVSCLPPSGPSFFNVGTGVDVSIRQLAETIKELVGFSGALSFDTSKPDGAPRKLLDVSRLKSLGWEARVDLLAGLEKTYRWYLDNQGELRT